MPVKGTKINYKGIFQQAAEAMIVLKKNSAVDWNLSALELFECSAEDISGKCPWDYSPEIQSDGSDSMIMAMTILEKVERERKITFQWTLKTQRGRIFPAEISLTALNQEESGLVLAVISDISRNIEIINENKRSNEKYTQLAELLPQIVFEADHLGRITYLNQAGMAISGYSPDDLEKGLPVDELMAEDSIDRFRQNFAVRLRGEVPEDQEYTVRFSDGSLHPVMVWVSPVLKDGKVDGIRGIVVDITHRKEAELRIKEAESILAEIVSKMPAGVVVFDSEKSEFKLWNEAARTILRQEHPGPGEDWLADKKILDSDGRGISRDEIPLYRALAGETVINQEMQIQYNGNSAWLMVNAAPVSAESGRLAVAVFSDISEQRKNMRLLHNLKAAVENADEDIILADSSGKIIYVNPAFERTTGYSSEESLGKNPSFLKSGAHDREFYSEMWESITSGKVWRGKFTNRRKDGKLIVQEAVISSIKDELGAINGFVSVKRDVTREENLRIQLIQSQKMEAIGTLAGGIAHDFNNILSGIIGNAEIALIHELSAGHPAVFSVEQILRAAQRASGLVRQILTFSRQREEGHHKLFLKPVLKEVFQLLRASLPSTVEICLDLQDEEMVIEADAVRIHQVVMNLCTNAAHAMAEKGGKMTISLKKAEIDGSGSEGGLEALDAGDYVQLSVADTGCGIPQQIRSQIFEPYFTTKKQGEGTGLGLAVVHGIVSGFGGKVLVDSIPGNGSVFHIFLPLVSPDEVHQSDLNGPLPGGSERILLVDDEKVVLDTTGKLLEILGYRVTAKKDPLEALETFRKNPSAFDVMITDMTMPGITGDRLTSEILGIRRDFPVILCTGFSNQISPEKALKIGIRGFLFKPVLMKQMADLLRQILDDEGPLQQKPSAEKHVRTG
ncbi:MAG: hypothetical protein CVV64_05075 [Candidatus Wallbacteria bacterium HGW-Wallbacteria-1]|jgi:PAS domain S-box-containing protein|uniref:histidine kinase n=1 Tax=Candidatus Wallbacteria bacterium HGW-Wallbacteria-1 TaxID=2013854 RepID=A0A2N1PS35_9BACT|nr:MAG: hypothetical protein CVV64_05075 [Candidatus Wallbacteria bacterium HGW-Wallbacteria-1]